MSISNPVSYQLLRLIKWRINDVIKGPNDPRGGKIGLKGKMGAITADRTQRPQRYDVPLPFRYLSSMSSLGMFTDLKATKYTQ